MRIAKLALCLVGLIAADAWSQEVATQPADPFNFTPPSGERVGGWRGRRAWPPDDEWNQVESFLKRNSPRRWKMFEHLPKEDKLPLKASMYMRWKGLEALREEDARLYELRVRRMGLEDDLGGLSFELRKTRTPAAEDAARRKLRDKAAELVKLDLDERQHRIEQAEKSLQRAKQRLEADRKRQDVLAEEHVARVTGQTPLPLDGEVPDQSPEHAPKPDGQAVAPPAAK